MTTDKDHIPIQLRILESFIKLTSLYLLYREECTFEYASVMKNILFKLTIKVN